MSRANTTQMTENEEYTLSIETDHVIETGTRTVVTVKALRDGVDESGLYLSGAASPSGTQILQKVIGPAAGVEIDIQYIYKIDAEQFEDVIEVTGISRI